MRCRPTPIDSDPCPGSLIHQHHEDVRGILTGSDAQSLDVFAGATVRSFNSPLGFTLLTRRDCGVAVVQSVSDYEAAEGERSLM